MGMPETPPPPDTVPVSRLRGALRRMNAGSMLRTGGAAAVAQLIVVGTMPIASRLFDEAAFGVLGLMVSLANILVLTLHLGYLDAVMAAESDEDADDLLRLVLALCMAGSVVNTAMVLAAIHFDILGYGKLPFWATGFVVAQSAAIALGFVFQQRLIRTRRFGPLAGSNIALGVGRGAGQVGFGLALPTPLGLVGAELFSRVAMAGFVIAHSPRALWSLAGRGHAMRALARRFGNFAGLRAGGLFLNGINLAMPTIIVAQHFSLTDVGVLSFALALIYAPIGLIQKAIGDIFTGTYRRALETDPAEAWQVFVQTALMLAGIGAGVAGILWAFGEPVFAFVFGDTWAAAGRTAELLAPMIGIMTLVIPLSASLNILRRPGVALVFNIMRVSAFGGLLVLVNPLALDYWQTVTGISAVSVFAYLGYGVAIARTTFKRSEIRE